MRTIKEVLDQLPPDIQQEVKNFAEFLLEKRRKRTGGKPSFDWAGALKDLRDDFTSVELEHEIADRRMSRLRGFSRRGRGAGGGGQQRAVSAVSAILSALSGSTSLQSATQLPRSLGRDHTLPIKRSYKRQRLNH